MLGVPLGSDTVVSQHVKNKLMTTAAKVMAKLVEFDDSQAAMYLLRLSYGIVRANHFMRTTPLPQWKEIAEKFDECVRDAVVQILGTTLPGDAYAQTCVSTRFGGLGIRRVVDHADVSFACSWHFSKLQVPVEAKDWSLPSHIPERMMFSQRCASTEIDAKTMDALIALARHLVTRKDCAVLTCLMPTRGSLRFPRSSMAKTLSCQSVCLSLLCAACSAFLC